MLFLKHKSLKDSQKNRQHFVAFHHVLHHEGGATWFGHFLILVLAIEKVGRMENSVFRRTFLNKILPTLIEPHKRKLVLSTFHYAACLKRDPYTGL